MAGLVVSDLTTGHRQQQRHGARQHQPRCHNRDTGETKRHYYFLASFLLVFFGRKIPICCFSTILQRVMTTLRNGSCFFPILCFSNQPPPRFFFFAFLPMGKISHLGRLALSPAIIFGECGLPSLARSLSYLARTKIPRREREIDCTGPFCLGPLKYGYHVRRKHHQ